MSSAPSSTLGQAIDAWLNANNLRLDCTGSSPTSGSSSSVHDADTIIDDCWRLHRWRTSQSCCTNSFIKAPRVNGSFSEEEEEEDEQRETSFGASKRTIQHWGSWWNATRNVRVSASHLPNVPVFTVEWEQILPVTYANAIEDFVDADVKSCAEWDSTYLGSDTISHFDLEFIKDTTRMTRSCRLLRYRFSIAGLGSPREMLYLVVADERARGSKHAKMRVYMSVVDKDGSKDDDAWRRITKGYVKATNLMPSFDAWEEVESAHDDGEDDATPSTPMLLMRHTMTSRLDGWMPDVVWNKLLRVFVERQYMHEGEKVRAMLHARARALSMDT